MEGTVHQLYQLSEVENQSKFQQQWKQGFKDTIQIENRIKILELEKQKKIKDIQKKLNTHKKNVELKILKHNRHQDVTNLHQQEQMYMTQHFNRFQQQKKKRVENIKSLQNNLRQTKNRQFWNVKKQREQIQKQIQQQRKIQQQNKLAKRNRVRLMEIQSKENVYSSWTRRLSQMKQSKQRLIDKKQRQHEQNLIQIAKMQKKEQKILDQIYKAENMEKDLSMMIDNQRSMSGEELTEIYTKL